MLQFKRECLRWEKAFVFFIKFLMPGTNFVSKYRFILYSDVRFLFWTQEAILKIWIFNQQLQKNYKKLTSLNIFWWTFNAVPLSLPLDGSACEKNQLDYFLTQTDIGCLCDTVVDSMFVGTSVTRLGDFWKILASKVLVKEAQMIGNLLWKTSL